MNKFEKYSSYKDSGIEWLGEIPEHWEVLKIKQLFFEKKKKHDINLNCGAISYGEVVKKDDNRVPEETKKSYQVVKSGDFLINPLNLNFDLVSLRIALSEMDVVVSSGYIVLDTLTNVNINKRYFKWLLHRYDVAFMKTLGSGVRQTLNFPQIGKSEIVLPLQEEQTKIASFLDEKTAQIDEVISQKEKLIELLKERKQIVINDAVTKGLDKNVEFIDSDVEWIGKIPKHWEVIKFKHLFYEKKKTHDISLNCGSISFGKVVEKNDEKIPASTKASYQVLNKGEFLINPLNLNYDLKSLRIGLSDLDVVVSSGYIIIKNKENIDKIYFNWLLHRYDIAFMKTLGAGVRQTLNFGDIAETLLVNPPIDEQMQIAEYIENQTTKIDIAIELQQKYISKLKEYKASLIDSVVTGKVKVS